MSEQKPEFPLPVMPRMGRRNAISPADKEMVDDDGAFSPVNLLDRASMTGYTYTSLDPEGSTSKKEKDEEQRKRSPVKEHETGKTFHPLTSSPPPSPTQQEGWNRIADAVTKVEAMLDPKETEKFKQRLGIPIDTPQEVQEEVVHKGGQQVIPWKKHDPNLHTITEERRKIFESFNKTSVEPPETPKQSESKLKRMMSKRFKKKKLQSESEESLLDIPVTPTKPKRRNPYANVTAKVNTRWDRYEDVIDSKEKLEKEHLRIARKAATIIGQAVGASLSTRQSKRASKSMSQTKTVVKKPGPTIKVKVMPKKEVPVAALKAGRPPKTPPRSNDQTTKPTSSPRPGPNYSATDGVKGYVPNKLPLTIGPPRHTPRKTMGMTQGAQNRADLVGETTTRLYGALPPYQRLKFEANQQQATVPPVVHGAGGTSYKSTFFNLHRINNGGITNNNKQALNNSVAQLIVVRRPDIGGIGQGFTIEKKKPGPPVTTIQAPPSPFMTSNISIPSQLNEIPVNGEMKQPVVAEKTSTAGPPAIKEKVLKKPAVPPAVATPPKRESVINTNRSSFGPNFGRGVPPRLYNRNNTSFSQRPQPPKALKAPAVAAAPKVKPAAKAARPNKYNNIYIGPYSGSESEGETQAAPRKKN